MRELVFALEFRGRAGPVPGAERLRHARTTAPSQTLSTMLGRDGIRADVAAATGEHALLESQVERFGDGSFVENGTIAYGSAGTIGFATIGRGWVGPAPGRGRVMGGVLWTITTADGAFAGASGLITSNFTVSAEGEVVDNHFARLYLP